MSDAERAQAPVLVRDARAPREPAQDDDGFDHPRGGGPWVPLVVDDVPFGFPVVRAVVGGVAVKALIDTGAAQSVVNRELRRRFVDDATEAGREAWRDAGGKVVVHKQFAVDVQVGALPAVTVHTVETTGLAAVDMALGQDFLQQVDVVLALDDGAAAFLPAGRAAAEPAAVPLLVQARSAWLVAHVRVPQPPGPDVFVPLVLDTGSTSTLLNEYDARALGIDGSHRARSWTWNGAMHMVGIAPIRGASLGGVRVGDVMADVANGSAPMNLGGEDLLDQFHVTYSRSRAAVLLAPRERRPPLRENGPGGAACAGACVAVAVVARAPDDVVVVPPPGRPPIVHGRRWLPRLVDVDVRADACLAVDVDRAYAGRVALLVVAFAQGAGGPAGGLAGFAVDVGEGGVHVCHALPSPTAGLGVVPGSAVELVRFAPLAHMPDACPPEHTVCTLP